MIGTSLHVRIVAGAYGVPRVTLTKRKPTEYARSWDSDMPYDVALNDLDHAIEAADRPRPAAASQARSADLALRAHEHLAGLAAEVTALARTQTERDAERRREARARHRARAERAACRGGPRRARRLGAAETAPPARCSGAWTRSPASRS